MNENILYELNAKVCEEKDLYDPEEIELMKANGKAGAQRLYMVFNNIVNEHINNGSATEATAFLNEMLSIISQIMPQEKFIEFERIVQNSLAN